MVDNFKFVIPADLEKGKDGEWRVRGLASTEAKDQQNEVIIQKGIDLTPIDQRKGLINWDHNNSPEYTIGTLDSYVKTPKGLYVEGRLFKNHTKAKAVYEIMTSLAEGDRGRVGMSVEGRILERDPLNPSVIKKCQIKNVALTMNPVNSDTYVDICKSLTSSEVEFESTEETKKQIESNSSEAIFTAEQVMAIVQKALSMGPAAIAAPDSKTGGDALQPSDMKPEMCDGCNKPRSKCECSKKKMKKMDKCMYKSNLIGILDKLQVLYPDHSRSEIWEAVKDRLDTKFDKGFRIKNISGKEREHKLYEQARQRDDYETNKDKTRQQLSEIARDSGLPAKERAQIRAQRDAAVQVGDRDHVRPNVKD